MYNAVKKTCLDVSDWKTADGTPVGPWQCCCLHAPYCGHCGAPTRNYNQAFGLDNRTNPPRIITSAQMGAKCLVVDNGAVVTKECDAAAAGVWLSYQQSETPPIRLSGNTSLCLSSVGGPPPHPSPSPPPPPYTPVQQACAAGSNTSGLPFCNTSLPTAARVADLVARMTLGEKVTQLIGGIGAGVTPGVPRLGLPPYQYHSEGLHGLRDCQVGVGIQLNSTMFPQVTAMAATGNLSLIRAMAVNMGTEARAVNNYLKGNTRGIGGGTCDGLNTF